MPCVRSPTRHPYTDARSSPLDDRSDRRGAGALPLAVENDLVAPDHRVDADANPGADPAVGSHRKRDEHGVPSRFCFACDRERREGAEHRSRNETVSGTVSERIVAALRHGPDLRLVENALAALSPQMQRRSVEALNGSLDLGAVRFGDTHLRARPRENTKLLD